MVQYSQDNRIEGKDILGRGMSKGRTRRGKDKEIWGSDSGAVIEGDRRR